jgi:hypothetical protein
LLVGGRALLPSKKGGRDAKPLAVLSRAAFKIRAVRA